MFLGLVDMWIFQGVVCPVVGELKSDLIRSSLSSGLKFLRIYFLADNFRDRDGRKFSCPRFKRYANGGHLPPRDVESLTVFFLFDFKAVGDGFGRYFLNDEMEVCMYL